MQLIYPALFHKENGAYWVEFPDLPGCQSFGDTTAETFLNAREALCAYCITLLEQHQPLAKPSDIDDIKADSSSFVSYIEAKITDKGRAIKKTLTIPSWLNDIAVENHINFSETLTNALLNQFNQQ